MVPKAKIRTSEADRKIDDATKAGKGGRQETVEF